MRRWDLPLGREQLRTGQDSGVETATISADAKQLVIGLQAHTATILRIGEYPGIKQLPTLVGHRSAVSSVAISRDGAMVATGGADSTVFIWGSATGAIHKGPLTHPDCVMLAEFSSDGGRLLTLTQEGTVSVWQVATGALQFPRFTIGRTAHASFNADGTTIATIENRELVFWDAETGQRRKSPPTFERSIKAGIFLTDPDRFLTATDDGEIQLWAVSAARQTASVRHGGQVAALAASLRGTYFATGGHDKLTRVWRTSDLREATSALRLRGEVGSLQFSPDERFLAAASTDGSVRVWEVIHGRLVAPPQLPHETIRNRQKSEDAKRIVCTFFTAASDGLWWVRRNGELDYLNLKPTSDSLEYLRAVSAAITGFEIDPRGSYLPLSPAALEKRSY